MIFATFETREFTHRQGDTTRDVARCHGFSIANTGSDWARGTIPAGRARWFRASTESCSGRTRMAAVFQPVVSFFAALSWMENRVPVASWLPVLHARVTSNDGVDAVLELTRVGHPPRSGCCQCSPFSHRDGVSTCH